MINVAELLKDAPKGMKLYSPLFGEVEYMQLGDDNKIWVKTSCGTYYFDKYGKPYAFDKAECLLFPSKDCRTWDGWKVPVEPKFKVGDWIACDADSFTLSIKSVRDENYYFHQGASLPIKEVDEHYHLWTIADAKDGDVLSTNSIICIFKKLDKDGYYIISPCIYTVKGGLEVIDDENDSIGSYGFKPATKEDRELLFRKMKEAGYEWDADKKELKKISKHYDIANFKPFDKVLVRDADSLKWTADLFSYIDDGFVCTGGIPCRQCIPFNDETKHLLGTADMPSEEYINW